MFAQRNIVQVVTAGLAVAVCLAAVSGCSSASASSNGPVTGAAGGIQRGMSPNSAREGHFSDPYPISLPPSLASSSTSFSGTFGETVTCKGSISPECFTPSNITIGYNTSLKSEFASAGVNVVSTKSHHISFTNGRWEMVFCIVVAKAGTDSSNSNNDWTLILHASPNTGATDTSAIPSAWTGDALLVGSLTKNVDANYDGKYYDDGGQLYLIYSKELSPKPHLDGLVAQRLDSPSQVDPTPPVTLLAPNTANGGLASENFSGLNQTGDFKLVETGNILKINGKYALVYSTGSYRRPDYKIGVAWSDTFLPASGSTYRKVMMPDPKGVWGNTGAEVDYLLQSQLANWPHYAGASVSAPGVGSFVQVNGAWYLFFAGYDPKEKPTGSSGSFNAADRQLYYVPIQLNVPAGTTVAKATDQQLQSWITPELN